jgi:hypothetical protein
VVRERKVQRHCTSYFLDFKEEKVHRGTSFALQKLGDKIYLRLWMRLQDVHLHDDSADTFVWSLISNIEYYLALAYEAQFFGATLTNFNKMVWKAWATPKVKFFS